MKEHLYVIILMILSVYLIDPPMVIETVSRILRLPLYPFERYLDHRVEMKKLEIDKIKEINQLKIE